MTEPSSLSRSQAEVPLTPKQVRKGSRRPGLSCQKNALAGSGRWGVRGPREADYAARLTPERGRERPAGRREASGRALGKEQGLPSRKGEGAAERAARRAEDAAHGSGGLPPEN